MAHVFKVTAISLSYEDLGCGRSGSEEICRLTHAQHEHMSCHEINCALHFVCVMQKRMWSQSKV